MESKADALLALLSTLLVGVIACAFSGAVGGALASFVLSKRRHYSNIKFLGYVLIGIIVGIATAAFLVVLKFSHMFPGRLELPQFILLGFPTSFLFSYLCGKSQFATQVPRIKSAAFEPLATHLSETITKSVKAVAEPALGINPAEVHLRKTNIPAGQVFLSYASPDREVAKGLAYALQREGWSVWWDRTIPPGESLAEVIEAALNAAKCVVVLWSAHSVTSDWVKNEAREGLQRRILIPALISPAAIPLEFRHIKAADLLGAPISDNPEFQSLVASIGALVGRSASLD